MHWETRCLQPYKAMLPRRSFSISEYIHWGYIDWHIVLTHDIPCSMPWTICISSIMRNTKPMTQGPSTQRNIPSVLVGLLIYILPLLLPYLE